MTSTPVTLLQKRSGNASDRPSGITLVNGELALTFGAADPGVYFEDSIGNIVKVGPNSFGTTAPNAVPVGVAGNSAGELWTDSSGGNYFLKVWTGAAWQKVYAGFADSATSATTATTAATATRALSSLVASGALVASGSIISSGVVAGCSIVLSGLPPVSTSISGSLVYQVQSSGTTPSGLFVRVLTGWAYTG